MRNYSTTRKLSSAVIDGKTVKPGDYVGFKSDIEQGGRILAITKGNWGVYLTLENPSGFSGEYIGGDTTTEVSINDCWVD